MASMVVPRCEFGLCALDGHLYAIGGWVGEDIGGSIELYDPNQDEWRLEGDLPEPRFSMGVVAYEGWINSVIIVLISSQSKIHNIHIFNYQICSS